MGSPPPPRHVKLALPKGSCPTNHPDMFSMEQGCIRGEEGVVGLEPKNLCTNYGPNQ